MDGTKFDQLIRQFGTTRITRLTALRGLAVGALGAALGFAAPDEADAKKKKRCSECYKKKKHQSKNGKTRIRCKAKANGTPCSVGTCQNSVCTRSVTPVTPATTCSPAAPVQCGNPAFCCPSNLPQCCVNAGIAGFSCAPSNYTCCGQQGDACAPSGESCCLPDPSVGGRQFSGCIPDGTVCCPFASDLLVREVAAAQIDGVGRGFCDRREVFDAGLFDIYPSYFCCPPDAGTDFGRCCEGRAEGNGPVEGGCCNRDAADPNAACPDGFVCDEFGCCNRLIG
jgi:hypothetical protein